MTIAVGQILDKYELLERVGHGGMAVVYRGLDRSLRRQVAIKVLHHHLAEHQEARERFEREAHAVAKLRHENILEIFDFSGGDSAESYIVTEFIEGPTLKEFIAEHQPKYPEIGALIATQVCRALAHAHSLGILHRDVKPENIMVRNDGVVKLTDFGIAQMVDMQRMTVTGQLIGSPAYMSPEHLEGKPLDFRTDVFAVGVVLYQLVVGELPFQGRNPHELLKRIADGTYKDPRQANPLVGNELGRIINKAMAHDKDARYADITAMLGALERYLEKSGINSSREELGRYFAAPVPYEIALRERLLAELSRRGRELLAADQIAALELFNRVLTIDPEHQEVLAQLDRLSRQQRITRLAMLFGSILAVVALAWGIRLLLRDDGEPPAVGRTQVASLRVGEDGRGITGTARPPEHQPGQHALPALGSADAAVPASRAAVDAAAAGGAPRQAPGRVDRATPPPLRHPAQQPSREPVQNTGNTGGSQNVERTGSGERPGGDLGPGGLVDQPPSAHLRTFTLNVWPLKSEYRVDDGPWTVIPETKMIFRVGPGAHTVEVRNPQCCQPTEHNIAADTQGGPLRLTLGYLPATVTPKCAMPGVRVQINRRPARLDHKASIPISGGLGRQDVTVTFFGERTDEHQLQLRYSESRVVTCAFD